MKNLQILELSDRLLSLTAGASFIFHNNKGL